MLVVIYDLMIELTECVFNYMICVLTWLVLMLWSSDVHAYDLMNMPYWFGMEFLNVHKGFQNKLHT